MRAGIADIRVGQSSEPWHPHCSASNLRLLLAALIQTTARFTFVAGVPRTAETLRYTRRTPPFVSGIRRGLLRKFASWPSHA